jgi:hypothetical protein
VIRVELEEGNLTPKALLYNVYHEGKLLLKGARDPEHEAARKLRDLGYTGRIGFFSVGGQILRSSSPCLVSLAGWTITEPKNQAPRRVKFIPFKDRHG